MMSPLRHPGRYVKDRGKGGKLGRTKTVQASERSIEASSGGTLRLNR